MVSVSDDICSNRSFGPLLSYQSKISPDTKCGLSTGQCTKNCRTGPSWVKRETKRTPPLKKHTPNYHRPHQNPASVSRFLAHMWELPTPVRAAGLITRRHCTIRITLAARRVPRADRGTAHSDAVALAGSPPLTRLENHSAQTSNASLAIFAEKALIGPCWRPPMCKHDRAVSNPRSRNII